MKRDMRAETEVYNPEGGQTKRSWFLQLHSSAAATSIDGAS